MNHLRTPQADADLDSIWRYIALQSGSYEVADRIIDSILDRFLLLAANPHLGRTRDEDLRPGLRSIRAALHEGRSMNQNAYFRYIINSPHKGADQGEEASFNPVLWRGEEAFTMLL